MVKKELVWKPKKVWSRKESRKFYKKLGKCKTKKELADLVGDLAWLIGELDFKLNELKDFVGNKKEY